MILLTLPWNKIVWNWNVLGLKIKSSAVQVKFVFNITEKYPSIACSINCALAVHLNKQLPVLMGGGLVQDHALVSALVVDLQSCVHSRMDITKETRVSWHVSTFSSEKPCSAGEVDILKCNTTGAQVCSKSLLFYFIYIFDEWLSCICLYISTYVMGGLNNNCITITFHLTFHSSIPASPTHSFIHSTHFFFSPSNYPQLLVDGGDFSSLTDTDSCQCTWEISVYACFCLIVCFVSSCFDCLIYRKVTFWLWKAEALQCCPLALCVWHVKFCESQGFVHSFNKNSEKQNCHTVAKIGLIHIIKICGMTRIIAIETAVKLQ